MSDISAKLETNLREKNGILLQAKNSVLNDIFKEPILSYKKERSLLKRLARGKLWERLKHERGSRAGLLLCRSVLIIKSLRS